MSFRDKNQAVVRREWLSLLATLALVLASCAPKNTLAVPNPISTTNAPQPTSTELATVTNETSLFRAGRNYTDIANDMVISFLDVVGFQAIVDEESEVLEVVLQMRDIPSTTLLESIPNVIQYSWAIFLYLDPATDNLTDVTGDYYFAVNTSFSDTSDSATPDASTASETPSGPTIVPINDLLQNKSVYDSEGMPKFKLAAVADPDLNVLTLTGNVPGITPEALFSFATSFLDGAIDRPDNYVPPESASLPEAVPSPTINAPLVSDPTRLTPVPEVRAYPGPAHYAGDVLTFEIPTDGSFDESVTVKLTLDDRDTKEVKGQGLFDRMVLPLALDTTNLSGIHAVRFTTADGRLNQTYSFEVLPANQRPKHEENASWLVNETDCCQLHYISNTAAARDIQFISEQFQQASQEVLTITGGSLDAKLNVYVIDRMWGNGGYAGEDGIVISYTDRHYGPLIGEKGLEMLARHELTHMTDLPGQDGDGVFFNVEGLAVYVAGGHYKPEPLAARSAALYDLGYYVPVEEYIDQHELNYLHGAAVLTYMTEAYGSEKLWEFVTADEDPNDGQPAPLEIAIQSTFDVSLNQFDQDFKAWLESKEPGKQLDDLRLTIELQDLRRQYQETYTPPPYFIAWDVAETITREEYLPVLIRESDAPVNAAAELLITNAQQAIIDGDYVQAELLIQTLEQIVTTGRFEDALAKEYLDIVLVLQAAGYDVLSLDIQGSQATAQVTTDPPVATSRELEKIDDVWQVRP